MTTTSPADRGGCCARCLTFRDVRASGPCVGCGERFEDCPPGPAASRAAPPARAQAGKDLQAIKLVLAGLALVSCLPAFYGDGHPLVAVIGLVVIGIVSSVAVRSDEARRAREAAAHSPRAAASAPSAARTIGTILGVLASVLVAGVVLLFALGLLLFAVCAGVFGKLHPH